MRFIKETSLPCLFLENGAMNIVGFGCVKAAPRNKKERGLQQQCALARSSLSETDLVELQADDCRAVLGQQTDPSPSHSAPARTALGVPTVVQGHPGGGAVRELVDVDGGAAQRVAPGAVRGRKTWLSDPLRCSKAPCPSFSLNSLWPVFGSTSFCLRTPCGGSPLASFC